MISSPRPPGACSIVVVGDDGAELLDGEGDSGHLVLPDSAVDEDGQVRLPVSSTPCVCGIDDVFFCK